MWYYRNSNNVYIRAVMDKKELDTEEQVIFIVKVFSGCQAFPS